MDADEFITWDKTLKLVSRNYVCAHCGNPLASEIGYGGKTRFNPAYIYICHFCTRPTFFDIYGEQTPGAPFGYSISHIRDEKIEQLYEEARSCFSVNAYTASVMCCRKLLMNIAVHEGAEEGKSFQEYVTYLETNNYIPPKGKIWADKIRIHGNEANHSIELKSVDDAQLILTFTAMLLRFIYEMPGLLEGQ